MIKVNLLRNRVQDAGTQTNIAGPAGELGEASQSRENLVKMVVMIIIPAALMAYEAQNLRSLTEEQNRLQAESARLQTEATAKATQADKLKDVEVQAKELEDKLKLLKLLSRLRLRHVKTLEFVQSSIPEKVWLKSVLYDSESAHIENGHFQFSGNATATEELTEFTRRLDGSAYLSDVIVVKNQEIATPNKSTIRDFLFTAEVEKRN